MSIYKQRKSRFWWIKIGSADGRTIRKSTGTEDVEKAKLVEHSLRMAYAKTCPARVIHQLVDAIYGTDHSGIPIARIWADYEQWQTASGKTPAVATQRNRKSTVARFAAWAAEHWPAAQTADDVDRQMATAFAAFLALDGTKGKTRRNMITDLSTVWEGLRHIRNKLDNPWPYVRPEARDSKRGQAFSREQETAILTAAKDGPWWLACMIARWTGLRYGDVAHLEWADVDDQTGVIRIQPNKTARHNITVTLPMAPPLASAMRAARAASADATAVLPSHAATYPKPQRKGGPGPFVTVLQAAGVSPDEYTFHSWRHTFRTRLSEAGVSDDIAKRLGGWTSDVTAARYDHAERIEEMRAAITKAG